MRLWNVARVHYVSKSTRVAASRDKRPSLQSCHIDGEPRLITRRRCAAKLFCTHAAHTWRLLGLLFLRGCCDCRKFLVHAQSPPLLLRTLAAGQHFCRFPEWRLDRESSSPLDSGHGGNASLHTFNSEIVKRGGFTLSFGVTGAFELTLNQSEERSSSNAGSVLNTVLLLLNLAR